MSTLEGLITTLEKFAPLRYAGSWDNVGLLVEPPHEAGRGRAVESVLLTIDLTEEVFEEALERGVEAIVAYHPVIFSGIKRLNMRDRTQRLVLRAVQESIAIYSPHTALDAAPGGLNDWLLEAFDEVKHVAPIESVDPEVPAAGPGRLAELSTPLTLEACLARIKAHLNLPFVRVASSSAHEGGALISKIAVCPGAGGTLFASVPHADLFLTGEMRHHDVLGRVQRGASVILTDHTNTERGYLPTLQGYLEGALDGVAVYVSERDRDPLRVV